MKAGISFERVVEYFESSGFDYMALDYAGVSLRLSREAPQTPADADALRVVEIVASSVGVVERPAGRERFPEAGERVAEGEVLFALRRFRSVAATRAPASGILDSVLVTEGDFVEFGQPLARLTGVIARSGKRDVAISGIPGIASSSHSSQ
jgi:acetyl/propionyl-CoA carboxylase alpha subunit